jgi:hypothetical protein
MAVLRGQISIGDDSTAQSSGELAQLGTENIPVGNKFAKGIYVQLG